MTVHIQRANLTYFSLPKVACTSLKHYFHEVRVGKPYVQRRPGRFIHHEYPTCLLAEVPLFHIQAKYKLLVVRDPLRRLVSAYRNRVWAHKELSEDVAGPALRAAGLDPNPWLGKFVDQMEEYQSVSPSMLHHTRPMVDFVGGDVSGFSIVCDIKEAQRLADFTNNLMGTEVALGRHQTEGGKETVADLNQAQREKLLDYYREDYKAFGSILLTPA